MAAADHPPVPEVDEDADWNETEDLGSEQLPPACEGGMSGWCGQLRKHRRCYFNHPDGITAVRARTYGMWDGHQWVCTCPCHEVQPTVGICRMSFLGDSLRRLGTLTVRTGRGRQRGRSGKHCRGHQPG
jgi:hypothetical protein